MCVSPKQPIQCRKNLVVCEICIPIFLEGTFVFSRSNGFFFDHPLFCVFVTFIPE